MHTPTVFTRNRATLKLMFVGALSLAMLIPLGMVGAIISERQVMQSDAQQTIARRWGGSQVVGGLVVLTRAPVTQHGDRIVEAKRKWQASTLSELTIEANLTTETRYLGIYEVPVYMARIVVQGRIDWPMLNALQPEGDLELWLPVKDVRGVRQISALSLGALQLPAGPLGIASGQHAGLQFTLPAAERARAAPEYRVEFSVAGSQSLQFLPLANTSRVALESDWPHPEFIGQYLPADRTILAEGTRANWQLLGLNRPYGNQWLLADMATERLHTADFGMRLETPADGYQRTERSVKYGFLFIALTFFTLFLFEVTTGRPLHPVPYVLTGAALAVFYLVLLALSEYLSFTGAFLIAAALLVLIVTPYTGVVLGGQRRGLLVGAMLSTTYGVLYLLVSSRHLALLFGSLTLLLAIAMLMYLTRGVDWYSYGNAEGAE